MKETIDQFMWGFQPHFRLSVEHETQDALGRAWVSVLHLTEYRYTFLSWSVR